jgi:hypothetical protein
LDRLDEMVKDRKSVAMVVMAEEIRGKERNMEKILREEIEWLWNGGKLLRGRRRVRRGGQVLRGDGLE